MIGAIRSDFCQCGCGQPLRPATYATKYHPARFLPSHGTRGRKYPNRLYVPAPEDIPSGLCECGCGRQTSIAKVTYKRRRQFAGHPYPFIRGHRIQPTLTEHHHFTGRRVAHGYVYIYKPEHPHARAGAFKGFVLEHRLVMETKLGRPLAPHETVHHIDGDSKNNALENLQLRQGKHGAGIAMACMDCGSHNVRPVPLE